MRRVVRQQRPTPADLLREADELRRIGRQILTTCGIALAAVLVLMSAGLIAWPWE